MPWLHWLDTTIAVAALGVALAMRPWRALVPPWPAFAWCALLPLLWNTDRLSQQPMLQPLAGSCLLMLMVGWPMAVLMLLAVACVTWAVAGAPGFDALHRLVWLGLVPVTTAMLLGAALRRWLPRHLFIYILGRAFLGTELAVASAGIVSVWLHGVPVGLSSGDVMLARTLVASGDAFITGMLVAIFVAYRPHWLATYADRIYLPK